MGRRITGLTELPAGADPGDKGAIQLFIHFVAVCSGFTDVTGIAGLTFMCQVVAAVSITISAVITQSTESAG